MPISCYHTVKSCYLAYAPDDSTTTTYALDNETRSMASSTLPNPPPNYDAVCEMTVWYCTACMHDIATYVPVPSIWYVTRRMLAKGRTSSFWRGSRYDWTGPVKLRCHREKRPCPSSGSPKSVLVSLETWINSGTGGLSQGAILQQLSVQTKAWKLPCMHTVLTETCMPYTNCMSQ